MHDERTDSEVISFTNFNPTIYGAPIREKIFNDLFLSFVAGVKKNSIWFSRFLHCFVPGNKIGVNVPAN